jgi:hypothetical protein
LALVVAAILSLAMAASASASFTQQTTLTPSDELGKSGLGSAVALSSNGKTALLGGPQDSNGIGAAWVFVRNGSKWTEQAKLTGEGEIGAGGFGTGVALSADGKTALIGGPGDDGRGSVWVFVRTGSRWVEQAKLAGLGEIGSGQFGSSVALSDNGDTALIGGPGDDFKPGAVWVFTRKGSTWTQQGSKLTGAGEETLDSRCVQILEGFATMEEILEYCSVNIEFGASVALSASGDTALIGGPGDAYEGGSSTRGPHGAAWMFTRSRSTWAQQGGKLAGNGSALFGVHFGSSVALSSDGNIALIGGPLDGWPEPPVGAAWVYARSAFTWIESEKLKKAEVIEHYERFGNSVSLSSDGDTALIVGAVEGARLFTQSHSRWVQQAGTVACGGVVECQGALSSDASTALVGTAVYVDAPPHK